MDKIKITLRCENWTEENFDAFYEWFSNECSDGLLGLYSDKSPAEIESYEVIHGKLANDR